MNLMEVRNGYSSGQGQGLHYGWRQQRISPAAKPTTASEHYIREVLRRFQRAQPFPDTWETTAEATLAQAPEGPCPQFGAIFFLYR